MFFLLLGGFVLGKMSNFLHFRFLIIALLSLTALSSALPTTSTSLEHVKKDIQSPANESTWSYYKTAALAAAIIVVSAGLAAVTALFFPVFVYKICYALGGCQDTLDHYVDKMIGVEGTTRRINRRALEIEGPIISALTNAEQKYALKRRTRSTDEKSSSASPTSMAYFEPIVATLAKGYEEYLDDDTKKNFKKLSFTR